MDAGMQAGVLLPLLIFAVTLLALAWLSGELAMEVQRFVYNITGSIDRAIVVYFLVFLPGIVVHEAAHWMVAWVLGLKPGKFRVWPVRRGSMVGLGSVTTRSGGPVLDSMVGVAPLVAGTLLVAIISRLWLPGGSIVGIFQSNDPAQWGRALRSAMGTADAFLWLYLLFAIANGMMPSKPDREPFKPVLIYLIVAAVFYLVIGLPISLLAEALNALRPPLEWMTSALFIVVAVDIAAILVLFVLNILTARRAP